MQNIQTLLDNHDACKPAREWANGKTWQTIYDTCDRGTWLTWVLSRSTPDPDKRTRVKLAAALANTVRDLMPDAAKEALDVAIRYGNGEATDDELKVAAEAAEAAARAAKAVEAAAAARAVEASRAAEAAEAAEAAAWVAKAVEAAEAAWAAAWAVEAEAEEAARAAAWAVEAEAEEATIEQQMANLVREIIPIELFNIDLNSTYNNQDC